MSFFGIGETLQSALARAVEFQNPDRPLVEFLGAGRTSARELEDLSYRTARVLSDLGVSKGDRVATFLDNRIEMLTTLIACASIGALWTPLNTGLRGGSLEYQLSDTEPKALVADVQYRDVLRAALSKEPSEKIHSLWVDGENLDEEVSNSLGGLQLNSELLQSIDPIVPIHASSGDPLAIMYTSGTTGPSKGIVMPHGQFFSHANAAQRVLETTRADRHFNSLPLFHGNAIFMSFLPALLDLSQVIFAPRFSASQFWAQIRASQATTVSMLGAMVPILWKQPENNLDHEHSLRVALVIPRPARYLAEWEERFNVHATELYGLTDAGNVLGVPANESRELSCGKPFPDWKTKLVDPNTGEPTRSGEVGELLLRPRRLNMTQQGYWNKPAATVEAWRDLWIRTGDLMRVDEEGWYYFSGRSKDAIRRFGENVSATEVEEALLEHPGVSEVAVYAVPNELSEDDVMTSVVLLGSGGLSPQDLIAHCEKRLPYYAVPRYVRFVEELPKTASQKIQKETLRGHGVTSDTWDRGPGGRRARERASSAQPGTRR